MSEEFKAYSTGLCFASVCTSLTNEEATRKLNEEHPTGVHPWTIHDGDFANGVKNPSPCGKNPNNRHILFSC